ncbi:hypothetical protein MMC07_004282 [Pseudocyphellaria aurata]|nr:hypothetical protein [Pseudocyphellaria aurata]
MASLSFVSHFVKTQLFTSLPYPSSDLTGQTIIVTGANIGLGLEAARHFTRLGAAKVILGVRNVEKGELARQSIEKSTNRQGIVDVWQVDLSSYESVKQFATRVENLNRVDVIVENAAIAAAAYARTEDNESNITTNVVSTFLLALLVLPKLRETATKFNVTPRLTIVSSGVHKLTDLPERKNADIFQTLNDRETADMEGRYNVTKLLGLLYGRELVNQMQKSDTPSVIINFVDPGLCHSELSRDAGWGLYFTKLIFARTTEVGSRTLVTGATAGTDCHGQYMGSCQIEEPSAFVRSEEGARTQKRVYDQLSQKLEKIHPGIMANV